jgi:hypothetical protein
MVQWRKRDPCQRFVEDNIPIIFLIIFFVLGVIFSGPPLHMDAVTNDSSNESDPESPLVKFITFIMLLIICAIVRYFALYGPSWQQVMHEFPGGREGFNTCLFANIGE